MGENPLSLLNNTAPKRRWRGNRRFFRNRIHRAEIRIADSATDGRRALDSVFFRGEDLAAVGFSGKISFIGCSPRCRDLKLIEKQLGEEPQRRRQIMKQLFWALLFGVCFAFVGYLAVDGKIPPLYLLGKTGGPITCGVLGLGVGFYLGNR
jgi:hypothetical protein